MVRPVLILICIVSLGSFGCLGIATVAYARDFGKYGISTEIKEEGFLAMIMRKLKEVDMTKEQEKMQKLIQERINEPKPVAGIIKTTKARSFTYDPTYTLAEDIRLPGGMLLYPKGTKVNPLDHMDLARELIFIDARDKAQEKWLETKIMEHGKRIEAKIKSNELDKEELVIILIGGRPLELQDKVKMAVYFDQSGELTSRLGIRQVPAIVTQEDQLLRIEEVDIGAREACKGEDHGK